MMAIASMTDGKPLAPGVLPCGHRLVVWPIPTSKTTKGGIVLPDITLGKEEMAQVDALVVSIGPTCWLDQKVGEWCKPGDTIKIAKYGGLVVTGRDGRTYRIINDLDVVGVCDE